MLQKKKKSFPLYAYIKDSMKSYFNNINKDDLQPENIYFSVMTKMEIPLIEATMEYTSNNRAVAAKILGMSRGTFIKKLKLYEML